MKNMPYLPMSLSAIKWAALHVSTADNLHDNRPIHQANVRPNCIINYN